MPHPREKLVSIHLLGPISLIGRDDEKLTPRGKKAQAILALLALAPRGQRTRAWLRDKLWSDSDEKHAASSLRQSLFEIKRDIGPLADQILTIDRHAIGLRLDLVWVDLLALAQDATLFRQLGLSPETELLEGMDISDPEFEDWLMMERQIWFDKAQTLDQAAPMLAVVQQPNIPAPTPAPVLTLEPAYSLGFLPNIQHGCQPETLFLADYVLESISKNLREFQPLSICDFREISSQTGNPLNVGDTEFYVRTRCLQVGNSMTLTLFLYRASQMQMEWSQSIQVLVSDVLAPDGIVLNGFIAQNVDRLAKSIFEDVRKSHDLHDMQRAGYSALNLMFRLDDKDFASAEGLLTDATTKQPHSIYPALKAYLSSFKIGENLGLIEEANTKAAERLLTGVVEDNPFNAISLSCLGHVFGYVFQEHEVAGSLLERALALNKSQAFVWDHYALHKIYTGQYDEAFKAAQQANFLGAYSPVSYSYDITMAMAATMTGDHGRAVAACKTALRKQPRSAAAMRYLIVNYVLQGKHEEAMKIYRDLLVIDPDFENPEVQMQRYRLTDTDMQAKFLDTIKILPNT
ncbi:MAG: tetratricopeptide repeat protein [Sulfitobacter sp.]